MYVAAALDGASMGWPWALPFVGLLLSIAAGPLLVPRTWRRHYGKIAVAWMILTIVSLSMAYGTDAAFSAAIHAILGEYLSFIVLLFTLYTVAGGILITGNLGGAPFANTAVLLLGTLMGSILGTTGAAMLFVRPLIQANTGRLHNAHVVIFFIVLVCNVGGALTPLGNPPLFAGFLHGVDFFWPAHNVWMQTAIVALPLLALFFMVDFWFYRKEAPPLKQALAQPIRLRGAINFGLIALIVISILLSAIWKPGVHFDVYGTSLELQNVLRDAALLTVLAMLRAGQAGAFAWLLRAVSGPDGLPHEAAYFWLTGSLSAFLDNAPTYLAFFALAGGNAKELMGPLAGTLASISMGAVYMGGLTYIGNAPNFMVYAIAEERGVKMPNFFGYMLWASLVLLPFLVLLTLLPIAPILRWP